LEWRLVRWDVFEDEEFDKDVEVDFGCDGVVVFLRSTHRPSRASFALARRLSPARAEPAS
jgi:hypothetical protein